ncbi:MAG: cysteine desulfurase NifS [Candidatus Komeilibacteria bacterium CG11_big_fil_rev_8_21_14_0_20_36_20]|uniref:Cysteine desulfurase NifS n=1 Tax=Candidatus Komeilibacteria bacterium CG11_big_fil_rev_8_21_14_0_20_36_20 TaxID=1974477 RepID=A0A2H0NEI8_9BACT|nr:MAG: cysteine desulfurase NifS [Candidatus Komeilibacteria bacterium CG11_big_fil_rev_8_21_14_0_20_36_20]PIR81759.1 MAG: cysteine desulfurase NifS [Candidatus Komeilibacteria bacterium CG10_big_fil_rev_8_21_14_0_10_36_65]PJC55576.1 MAG: cysteine desulfurase NifS [Candidatus Komeilibacteria bacterium CG_4_9_14_0_2_um_filter_36_13]
MPKSIYLDYAATTPTDPRVVKAMQPYWSKNFGNPSSLYRLGRVSQQAIAQSRQLVAKFLGCQPEEIIFTGGGTASINLGLKGVLIAQEKNSHLITSSIEHHAVLHTAETLHHAGHKISILPVDKNGLVQLKNLEKAIENKTVLVSIMMANNEIGTLQPIQQLGTFITKLNKQRLAKKLPRIYFHTDACQAAGALDLDVNKLHVDLLTLNGSKIYGPKGVGVLYVRRGTPIQAILDGGGQEKNLRSGTENVPGIVGLATALNLVNKNKIKENIRLIKLRDWLIKQILTKVPKTILNGHPNYRLPNNVNVSVLDIEGEALLLHLDQVGIQCSTGSACTSTTLEPSHVIRALGYPYEAAHGSMRFTLGKQTTQKDLKYLMSKLPPLVKKLRQGSPVNIQVQEITQAVQDAPRKIKILK